MRRFEESAIIEYKRELSETFEKATQRVLDKLEVENRTFTKITSKRRLQKRMIEANALREAVINAIVHNDYSYEAPPKFEFFSDRMEITSTGGLPPPQVTPQVTPQVVRLLTVIEQEMNRDELQTALKLKDRKSFRELYIQPALVANLIEMTIPDKPNSRLQKYRLTEQGKNIRLVAGEE